MSKRTEKPKSKEQLPPAPLSEFVEVTPLLIADLKEFVTKNKGPSLLLDSSLKKDRTLYSRLAATFGDKPKMLPLALAMKLSRYCGEEYTLKREEHIIEYLLANGAAIRDNQSIERNLFLSDDPLIYINSRFSCQNFLDAGYSPGLNDISYKFIPTDLMFSKLRSPSSLSLNLSLSMSISHNDLNHIQFYLQKGADINALSSYHKGMIGGECCFDILRYFFAHPEFKKTDGSLGQIFLEGAVRTRNYQKIHFLVTHYNYPKTIIQKILDSAKAAPTFSDTYRNLYYTFNSSERPKEFEQLEQQCLQFASAVKLIIGSRHHKEIGLISHQLFSLNRAIHLALIYQEDKAPTFDQINRLLPINFFAAQYAWLPCFHWQINAEDNAMMPTIRFVLAQRYRYYLKQTNHIAEMGIHDSLIELIYKDRTIFEALGIFITLKILTNLTVNAFPIPISYLIMGYITGVNSPPSVSIAPELTHIWGALTSEKQCNYCKVSLSEEKNLIFFSEKNQKIKISSAQEIYSPKT